MIGRAGLTPESVSCHLAGAFLPSRAVLPYQLLNYRLGNIASRHSTPHRCICIQ